MVKKNFSKQKTDPNMNQFLQNKDLDYKVLNKYRDRLILLTEERIDKMERLFE